MQAVSFEFGNRIYIGDGPHRKIKVAPRHLINVDGSTLTACGLYVPKHLTRWNFGPRGVHDPLDVHVDEFVKAHVTCKNCLRSYS